MNIFSKIVDILGYWEIVSRKIEIQVYCKNNNKKYINPQKFLFGVNWVNILWHFIFLPSSIFFFSFFEIIDGSNCKNIAQSWHTTCKSSSKISNPIFNYPFNSAKYTRKVPCLKSMYLSKYHLESWNIFLFSLPMIESKRCVLARAHLIKGTPPPCTLVRFWKVQNMSSSFLFHIQHTLDVMFNLIWRWWIVVTVEFCLCLHPFACQHHSIAINLSSSAPM